MLTYLWKNIECWSHTYFHYIHVYDILILRIFIHVFIQCVLITSNPTIHASLSWLSLSCLFFFQHYILFFFLSCFLITHWIQSWYIYMRICLRPFTGVSSTNQRSQSSSQNSHQQYIIAPQRRPMCWHIFKHFYKWTILKKYLKFLYFCTLAEYIGLSRKIFRT